MKFEARIKELVEDIPDLVTLVEPLLIVRRTLREQIDVLYRRLLAIVRDDEVCRRLMTVPGVGPVVALTYRVTVDVPAARCKSAGLSAVSESRISSNSVATWPAKEPGLPPLVPAGLSDHRLGALSDRHLRSDGPVESGIATAVFHETLGEAERHRCSIAEIDAP